MTIIPALHSPWALLALRVALSFAIGFLLARMVARWWFRLIEIEAIIEPDGTHPGERITARTRCRRGAESEACNALASHLCMERKRIIFGRYAWREVPKK